MLGHFLHARIGVFKESFVYAAPTVNAGYAIAFALTSVSAKAVPTAGSAVFGDGKGFFQKSFFPVRSKHSLERVIRDAAQFPFVQRVKITGIYAAVAFNDEAWPAMADHRAVFWGHSHEHGDPVVKVTDRNGMAFKVGLIIAVKRACQERKVSFTAE